MPARRQRVIVKRLHWRAAGPRRPHATAAPALAKRHAVLAAQCAAAGAAPPTIHARHVRRAAALMHAEGCGLRCRAESKGHWRRQGRARRGLWHA